MSFVHIVLSKRGNRGDSCFQGLNLRGKSGLHRAGCWLIASESNLKESATENTPPYQNR